MLMTKYGPIPHWHYGKKFEMGVGHFGISKTVEHTFAKYIFFIINRQIQIGVFLFSINLLF